MLTLLLASSAFASDLVEVDAYRRPPPPPPRPYTPRPHVVVADVDPDFDASLTLGVHAMGVPMLGGAAEFRVAPSIGLEVDAGFAQPLGYAVYDIGGQARYYAAGDFDRGLFLAGSVGGTNVDPFQIGDPTLRVGAWLGGKYSFSGGLTAEAAVALQGYSNDVHVVLAPAATVGIGFSF